MLRELLSLSEFWRDEALFKKVGIQYVGKYNPHPEYKLGHRFWQLQSEQSVERVKVFHGTQLPAKSIISILTEGFKTVEGMETFSDSGPFGGDAIRFARQLNSESKSQYGIIFAFDLPRFRITEIGPHRETGAHRYKIARTRLVDGSYHPIYKHTIPPTAICGCWLIHQDNKLPSVHFVGKSADEILPKIKVLVAKGVL